MGTRGAKLPLLSLSLMAAAAGQAQSGPELTYFGRSTFKIKTASGFVVYIDPFAPGDYSEPADLVLVTHGHGDHNLVSKTTRKNEGKIVAPVDAVPRMPVLVIEEGQTKIVGPVEIRAVPAANSNHPRGFGLGYILSFDGVVIYVSGDTSRLPEMAGWTQYGIDWAFLCSDGFYNMNAEEAARSAALMGAKRLVPIHTSKDGLFDEKVARSVKYKDVTILAPGDRLQLKK
jgi:L-ascorbate metabolism protein UlaG (beta-lactamase superfamily)